LSGADKPDIDRQCEAAGSARMKDGNFIGPVTHTSWKNLQKKWCSRSMCNLYSITTNQAAIIALFRAVSAVIGLRYGCGDVVGDRFTHAGFLVLILVCAAS
jgi:hypothetical protein